MSAPSKKKKTISKDELRRLMKQTKSSSKKEIKRIEHQYAKYNSLGQLLCTLCGTNIKSELIWPTHLQSKSHKEFVIISKSKTNSIKRPIAESADEPHSKKSKDSKGSKSTSSGLPPDFFDNKAAKTNHQNSTALAAYSSSEDEDEKPPQKTPSLPSGLPTDFFDSAQMTEAAEIEEPKKISDVLPEGFFDDPKMDAKVRKVEYKDKMEEEWEMFQKSMKEEAHVSEVIVEEDDELANFDRNIDEIDEQIQKLQEVNDLQNKKEAIMKCVKDVKNNDNSSDELDEDDINDFFDWRSKKSWK
ncbi:zinc finger protein 830 [Patella vulgata]|uniref:zinc finger protein 830 n=1 Tax=Patella vulgata TaxID=6465 RepID=UPI00217F47A1|nr:zinc finger protein 830 [Patella vulgata]